jgi:hypothetical protein
MIKFIKCSNPVINHIKMVYGDQEKNWRKYKCECGYDFEGFIDVPSELTIDNHPSFQDVDPEADTKILSAIKVLDNQK